MRNFKKFLALVLAMLMVSACAVSVSAAFNDQAAIDATDFEDAVEILAELGVVKGDENQNFNPNNTLRRDEAAVIIAKLVAGIAGQSMDWTAATTKFADVDAAWSFAYINYVADRKIMVGSNIGFEPTRELQIDEALALALKAADPAAVRNVEIMNAQYPTNYWATYYISAAEELGLADNLGIIYDHEAACSRAMFAQIAVNMLNNSAIGDAFGYQTKDGYITSVDADNNKLYLSSLGETAINLAAFNATLAEAGYEKVAADMIDYKVSMQWSNKTGEIFEIDVLSSVDTYNYTDAAIKYVPDPDDSNKVLAKKLELNGKVYDINADDYRYDEDDVSDVIGGTLADDLNNIRFYDVNNHNEITTVVKDATIPAFYEVACFDDDADGDYERAYVTTYDLVTLTKGDEIDHDENGDTAKVNATKVTVFGKDVTSTHALSGQYLTVDGAAYTAWGETPVLVYLVDGDKATMTGKILETADKVTGVVSSIKAGSYITIGDKIAFAAAYTAPESWTLSQNVTIYTIGGNYVAVASADTGVESGKVEKQVLVNNVTVADGKALIDGYVWNSNGTFSAIEDMIVVGYVNGGKLLSKASAEIKNVVSDKTYAGLVGIGTLTDAGDAFKADDHVVTFRDGYVYSFYVTAEGAYYDKFVADIESYKASTSTAVEIKGQFIYVNGTAQYKLEDAYTVLARTEVTDNTKADYYNAYGKESYTILPSFKFDSATANYIAKDKVNSTVAAGQVDKKVAFVYVTASSNVAKDVLYKNLNEGETIVQLVSVENETLTESTFNAINIFTGEKLTVTGNDKAGNYAVVKDGKIVDDNTMWVEKNLTLDVKFAVEGRTITGDNRMIHCDPEGKNPYMDNDWYKDDVLTNPNSKDDVTYGVDKITYWAFKDGAIDKAGDFDAIFKDKNAIGSTGTLTFNGCIINGQVIILDTPTYVVD